MSLRGAGSPGPGALFQLQGLGIRGQPRAAGQTPKPAGLSGIPRRWGEGAAAPPRSGETRAVGPRALSRERKGRRCAAAAAAARAGWGPAPPWARPRTALGSTHASFVLTVLGADRLPSAAVSEHRQRPLHLRGGVHVEFHSHRGQPVSWSQGLVAATTEAAAATAWNGPERGRGDCREHRSPGPAAGQGGKERRGGGGSEPCGRAGSEVPREGGLSIFAQLENE